MRRTASWVTVTVSALSAGLAACSSSATTSASGQAATQPATSAAAPASTAAASTAAATQAATKAATRPSFTASAVPTTLDPCQVVTAAEASALAGTTFGAGKEEPSGTNGKLCVYGYQTTNVFTVIVGQAATQAAAQAAWSQAESEAKSTLSKQLPSGMTLNVHTQDVPGLGDRAATVTGSASIEGRTIGASAIYLLKGATFVTFADEQLGSHTPSAADMETEAQTALSRVP